MTFIDVSSYAPDALQPAPCPYFKQCGGCTVQELNHQAYQSWKENRVFSLLKENELSPHHFLPSVFIGAGSRRRATFVAEKTADGFRMGFHPYHDHSIVDIESCLLLSPRLHKAYHALRASLPPLLPRGKKVDVWLQMGDDEAIDCVITGLNPLDDKRLSAKQTALIAEMAEACDFKRVSFREGENDACIPHVELEKIYKTSGGLKVTIAAGSFLQPSTEGEAALANAVMDGLGKITKKDKVLDLFSGCGTFAGHMVNSAFVHAVEGDFAMAESLKRAAEGNARLTAEHRDLFKEPMTTRELNAYKVVVMDPPRAGAKEQARKLVQSSVPRIISVSCNPATFARDAKTLTAGGYKFLSVQLIDQFPYTAHAELVGVFQRAI